MREGWEYKKFENCIVKSPKLKQVKKEAYNNGSQYPIISQYCCPVTLFHI